MSFIYDTVAEQEGCLSPPSSAFLGPFEPGITGENRFKQHLVWCQRRVRQQLMSGVPLTEVMDTVLELIQQLHPRCICSVMSLDSVSQRLYNLASRGLPQEYPPKVEGLLIGPTIGACGSAAFSGKRVVVENTYTSPLFADFLPLMQQFEFKACWSQPILAYDNTVLGTFAFYYHHHKSPSPEEIELMELAAEIAAGAIEWHQTEEHLLKSEEQLSMALQATNDGLWDWNIQQQTVYYSPKWAEMLGYDSSDLKHDYSTWEKLLHPEDKAGILEALNNHLNGSQETYEYECRMLTKAGDWKWVLTRGKVFTRDEAGNPLRMLGTHTDISLRKKVEAQLATQNEELAIAITQLKNTDHLRSFFVSALAHDLRTPLIAQKRVLNDFETLFLDRADLKPLSQLTQGLMKSNDGLLDMVNKLLEIYQYEDGQMVLQLEHVNLTDLVEACYEELANLAKAKNIQLTHSLKKDLPKVEADAKQLKRVFMNLIGNAIVHIPENCKVDISAEVTKNTLDIKVQDNGHGINPEILPHLFERYFVGHHTRQKIGAGLGLYICKMIVNSHSGQIFAKSVSNQGSVFIIKLPFTQNLKDT